MLPPQGRGHRVRAGTSVASKVMDVRVEPRISGMLPKDGLAFVELHRWLLDMRLT